MTQIDANRMDILISEDLQAPAIERLQKKYQVVRESGLWRDTTRLEEALGKARTVMVRNQTQLTGALLAGARHLIGIGRVGVGLDNIDVAAATKLGVVVVAPLNANAVSVAELTLGLLLGLARKIPQADRSTKAGGWDRKGCTGIELDGRTLGICGLGRIGRLVATRARSFGMQILAYDPFVAAGSAALVESGVTLCGSLEELLAAADVVTVHSPLTPETRYLFNAATFAAMKRGAFFINTSRGGVMDEAALVTALKNGHLGGAALDVREMEPPAAKAALEAIENVILTPHIGAFTAEAQTRTFEAVAGDLDRLLSGKPAVDFVNFDRPKR
jgi:D-3-phosphoglycerate dehydrogenase